MKKTAIYALTHQGASLGKTLTEKIEGDLFLPSRIADAYEGIPFNHLMETVAENFSRYPRQIFIAATGIVVRSIAPHLRSKDSDPGVVVLDQKGRYVISLLSGHLGGANALAAEVAQLTGGEAVITTATETEGVPSIDLLAKERNLFIANFGAVKRINMAVLEGKPVQLLDRSAICMQDFMPPLCKLSAQLHMKGVAGMVVDEDTHSLIFQFLPQTQRSQKKLLFALCGSVVNSFHSIFITTFCVSEKKITLNGFAVFII